MANSDVAARIAFLGAVCFGGSNYVAVTFSNRELEPFFGAMLRFTVASMLFFLLARIKKLPRLDARQKKVASFYGLIGFGSAYAFLYVALLDLGAGTVATVLACVPLLTLMIAAAAGQEKITPRGLAAGALAVAGIAVLSAGKLGGALPVGGVLAALAGASSSGGATVIAKAIPKVHPIQMNAYGMGVGSVFLLVASLVAGETWSLPDERATWLALAWLCTIGSIGLFWLFLYVVHEWTASAAVYGITAMPVVAATLGAVLLDQPITGQLALGAVIIAGAVVLGARPPGERRGETAGAEPIVS
ncbi:MAG: DMT family transporter [Actinomycetota bacterium]